MDTFGTRRVPMLAALLSFCLNALAGPVAAASQHLARNGGDAILAGVSAAARAAGTASDRLTPAHRSAPDHRLPPSAALPLGILVAFLLAVTARRGDAVGSSSRSRLLTAAGRGPPVTS